MYGTIFLYYRLPQNGFHFFKDLLIVWWINVSANSLFTYFRINFVSWRLHAGACGFYFFFQKTSGCKLYNVAWIKINNVLFCIWKLYNWAECTSYFFLLFLPCLSRYFIYIFRRKCKQYDINIFRIDILYYLKRKILPKQRNVEIYPT